MMERKIRQLEDATRNLARHRDPGDIHFFKAIALDWRLSHDVRKLALDTIYAIGGKEAKKVLASIARKSDDWVGVAIRDSMRRQGIRDGICEFLPLADGLATSG
jgi:hypothetical protein